MKKILSILITLSVTLIVGCKTSDVSRINLDGKWECQKIWDGAHLDWDSSLTNNITFQGNLLTVAIMDDIIEGQYVLDENQHPPAIDLIYNQNERQVLTPAIITVSNNLFTICHYMDDREKRPLSFDPESGVYIGIYKRKN